MKAKIEELIKSVAELREHDVSHPELGSASNFTEAENSKKQLIAYLDSILGLALQLREHVNQAILDTSLQSVEKALNSLRQDVKNIEEAVAAGIHTPEFPKHRTSFVKATGDHLRQFETALHPFETTLRLVNLEQRITNDAALNQRRTQFEEGFAQAARAKDEIEKALANVRDRVAERSIKDAETGFGRLAAAHASRERAWFVTFVIAGVVLSAAIVWAAFSSMPIDNAAAAVAAVFRKLLVVTAAAVILRLALGKYNAERNLRIIYDHRGAVLSQYTLFENAIGDDVDGRVAKNQFRLELAKYIFTDPATGYISSDAAADININPVISTIERFGLKG